MSQYNIQDLAYLTAQIWMTFKAKLCWNIKVGFEPHICHSTTDLYNIGYDEMKSGK